MCSISLHICEVNPHLLSLPLYLKILTNVSAIQVEIVQHARMAPTHSHANALQDGMEPCVMKVNSLQRDMIKYF